jgi:putative ABC transport system permease protein
MKVSQYLRLTARESRGSRRRLLLFVACLAVGVAAIVAVGSLSASMDQGIRTEARKLLGADVAVSARRPVPDALTSLLEGDERPTDGPILRTSVRELVTVAAAPPRDGVPGRSRLVELKVVDGVFPFYGSLTG